MIVNSSLPPMRQSASSGAGPASTKNASEDRMLQMRKHDFDAMVKSGNSPFSSLSTPTQNETAESLFVVQTATQAYTVETVVGDSAVSFDARPIVGPVSTAPNGSPEASASISGPKNALDQQVAPQIATPPPTLQVGTSKSPTASHQLGQSAALRSDSGVVDHGPRAPVLNTQNPLFGSRANVGAPKVESKSTARMGTPASLPPQTAARGANFAALVATLPQEVRVTVRGMTLGQSEREELAREIRAALAGHGLDHRSIHIISGQGTI